MNILSLFNLSSLHSQLYLLLTATRTKATFHIPQVLRPFHPMHWRFLFLHLRPVLWALLFTQNCSSVTLALHTFSTACREGGFFNVSLICKKPDVLKIKTKMFIFIASSNFFRESPVTTKALNKQSSSHFLHFLTGHIFLSPL